MATARYQHALDAADRSCDADADCVYAPFSTECFRGCPSDAVSAAGRDQVQAAVDAIDSDICASFADGCSVGGPFCPASSTPVCWQGRCEAYLGGCAGVWGAAVGELTKLVTDSDPGCSSDADCTLLTPETRCARACAAVIARAARDDLDAAFSKTEQHYCPQLEAGNCGPEELMPNCGSAPSGARCSAGRCVTVP